MTRNFDRSLPLPAAASFVELTADQQKRALQRTSTLMKELDKIRRSLKLPADQLHFVIEAYGRVGSAIIDEDAQARRLANARRMPLPLRSEAPSGTDVHSIVPTKLRAGMCYAVKTAAQGSFTPEKISISRNRSHWLVHDIKIGNRTQLVTNCRHPIAGTEFSPDGICENLRLSRMTSGMDFTIHVEYIGPDPDGEIFEAVVVGLEEP